MLSDMNRLVNQLNTMDTDTIPENRELSESAQRLLEYKDKGYVFHGSESGSIEVLEPRQARDTDSANTFNNDTAVFATDRPEASIIFACMHIPKYLIQGEEWRIYTDQNNRVVAEIPSKWRDAISFNRGSVYVLDGKDFEKGKGWQVKSNISAVPIERIDISFADFESLGGTVIWTD